VNENRTDAELLARVRDDPDALEGLYRRHVESVVSYATRRCDQPADVADLVAATFLAILESAGTYDPAMGDARPWILGVAGRIQSRKRRRQWRERDALTRSGTRRALVPDDFARLERAIDASRRHGELEQAMQTLSYRHREVLLLIGPDGLDHAQAAVALGLSPSAFRNRLLRARRALRRALPEPRNATIETTTAPEGTS
jgi:RNA polymerase sigma factor (sigma-70 family)